MWSIGRTSGKGVSSNPERLLIVYGVLCGLAVAPVHGVDRSYERVEAVSTQYVGDASVVDRLADGGSARALTVADFDEDGIPDLVVAFSDRVGGALVVHRGNADALYPNTVEAKKRRAAGRATDSAFLSPSRVFATDIGPDVLAAGDFDADGHIDLLAASVGVDTIYLHRGDGSGGLAPSEPLRLPGSLSSMATGEVNRRDGLADVVAAVHSIDGPVVLVYEHPSGAFAADPEVLEVDAEVVDLALGQLDGRPCADLVIATSNALQIVHGRDRYPSGTTLGQPVVSRLRLPFSVVAVATGDFAVGSPGRDELAVLTKDGELRLVARIDEVGSSFKSAAWTEDPGEWNILDATGWSLSRQLGHLKNCRLAGPRSRLLRARLTGSRVDDLVVVGWEADRLAVMSAAEHARERTSAEVVSKPPPDSLPIAAGGTRRAPKQLVAGEALGYSVPTTRPLSVVGLPLEASPRDIVSMRLTDEAIGDLVLLVGGGSDPIVIRSKADETVVVTSTSDAVDGDTSSISNLAASPGADGVITLREAITAANNTAGADRIDFNIPVDADPGCDLGSGVCTIQPGGAGLPTITQPLTIDGTSQPSFETTPVIEIDGSLATIDATGIAITAGTSTVRGLVINRFAGNSDIVMWGAGGNIVEGNFLGVDASGSFNRGTTNSVHVYAISNNIVGGTTAAARNVISGNTNPGVALNAGASNNLVQGNFIGTDLTGTVALGNNGNDIIVVDSADNTIGGTEAGAGNLVAGNLDPEFASIGLGYPGTTGNLVQGNFVGTDLDGINALGGASIGVYIAEGSGNTIGGTSPNAFNVISGVERSGVGIAIASANSVQGNYIGTQIDGSTPLPNGSHGVLLYAGAANNTVGGRFDGARNVIAYNGGGGVELRGDAGIGNTVVGNSITANTDLGLNLCADYDAVNMVCSDLTAVTPNDTDDPDVGSNNLQNYPTLTSVRGGIFVEGTLDSVAGSNFVIDFYANPVCDSSGNGEGEIFLGSESVTTDENGDVAFTAYLPGSLQDGWSVTATATDVDGSTSEFSSCLPYVSDVIFSDGFESGDASVWSSSSP
jgi:hypothetical protein